MVSRRHAAVRPCNCQLIVFTPLPASVDSFGLNSSNGTLANGQRLQGCRELQMGDRIMLGDNGAEFIFECSSTTSRQLIVTHTPTAAASAHSIDHSVSFTQLFPIVSTGRLIRKAYLVPGILTVVFVVVMFTTAGKPEAA